MNTALRIARASTRLRSPVPIAPERLVAWEAGFANLDGEALVSRWVQPDEWLLIRRLRLHPRWRVDEADVEVGLAWGSALDRAIGQAIAQAQNNDDGNCVRYRHRREALADLVYRSALRDSSRQWAWQRMHLIPRAGLPPDEALRCALREIEREPELAWPVLMRLLQAEPATAAFTAALRALGGSLLPQLLRLSPRSAPYLNLQAASPVHQMLPEVDDASAHPVWPTAAARELVRWTRGRAAWAQRHRGTLAPLLAALAWPGSGATARTLRQWLDRAQVEIRAAGASLPSPDLGILPIALAEPTQAAAPLAAPEPAEPAPAPAALPLATLPALPANDGSLATCWGGALFWLTRLGAAWLDSEPRPELALWLRETALALGVPADDAVLPAFCGGELPRGDAPPGVVEAACAWVGDQETWLQGVAPELPEPRVTAVCRREGRLDMDAGWIVLHLPLAAVDTAIRRLGLDLDPGWLPWLGTVVRIRYDDA